MLTYLILCVDDLIATAILFALVMAYFDVSSDKTSKRIMLVGLGVAVAMSAAMAFMKQTTAKIDTGLWNLYIFAFCAIVLALCLVLFIKPLAKVTGIAGQRIREVLLALFVGARVFYKLPDVILYPFNFTLSEGTIVSTDFLFRVIGMVLGIVLVVLLAFASYKCARTLPRRMAGVFAMAPAVIIAVVQIMTGFGTMLARRYIASSHELFVTVKFFANNSALFTFVIIACGLVPILVVLARSFTQHEPYSNPAQHRKIKAKWRNYRRWAACSIVCVILAVLTLTVISDYNSRGPEIAPVEQCEVRDGACYVSFEQVSDGHLHRFAWEMENGTAIRFIIIQKPNSSAYGIGLDACEICGETGYYERDGQVVCKLCDVVMNINTIGFKGGCNPIPIEYSIDGGFIIIPTEGLMKYEHTFSS